jgi:hypothetical protein
MFRVAQLLGILTGAMYADTEMRYASIANRTERKSGILFDVSGPDEIRRNGARLDTKGLGNGLESRAVAGPKRLVGD